MVSISYTPVSCNSCQFVILNRQKDADLTRLVPCTEINIRVLFENKLCYIIFEVKTYKYQNVSLENGEITIFNVSSRISTQCMNVLTNA